MKDKLNELVRKGNGIVTSAVATEAGVVRRELSEAVERGELVRLSRGMYATPDTWEDEFVLAQHRFSRGVFSHETALYLHELTDRAPDELIMTFPHGYNTGNARASGIDARTVTAKHHDIGVTEVTTPYGNTVKAYCAELTLCDLFRSNPSPDLQLALPAIRSYLASEGRNTVCLMEYARRRRVEARLRPYVEAML